MGHNLPNHWPAGNVGIARSVPESRRTAFGPRPKLTQYRNIEGGRPKAPVADATPFYYALRAARCGLKELPRFSQEPALFTRMLGLPSVSVDTGASRKPAAWL